MSVPDNHNQDAIRLRALEYDALGDNIVREHAALYHEYDLPALHVPADRPGVST
jgi:hypothetical protein